MMLSTITSLVNALEARDTYTKGHSTAVAKIAADLLKLSGASSQDVQTILIGGHLHDIGKIGISDAILLKPGRLNKQEFDCIKQHPDIGANILAPIESLTDIIPMVRYHNERMDGKGYSQWTQRVKDPPMGKNRSPQMPLTLHLQSVFPWQYTTINREDSQLPDYTTPSYQVRFETYSRNCLL